MPGHYGSERVTIQNLEIVKVDAERNVLLVKGSVPGPKGAILTIKSAVKAQEKRSYKLCQKLKFII